MNKLPIEKRVQIINLLVEGSSLRTASRIADVSINTVTKLLVEVGQACAKFHDEKVQQIKSERVQCDEIWSFVYAKQRNVTQEMEETAGDAWTFVGIDADTKLVISWLVGERDPDTASAFMNDVAMRLANRVQLSTDGFKPYLKAVAENFGNSIDFAQLIKYYSNDKDMKAQGKYSPPVCIGTKKTAYIGDPNPDFVSTSYVERQNLTMRMHMRRFTRLTNAFSKKLENHCHAIALHFVYYNFCKIHKTLRVPPAMEAGLIKRIMTLEDIVRLTDSK